MNRDTRRVIAPILQSPQPIEEHRGCLLVTYVTDDSAHPPTLVDGIAMRTGRARIRPLVLKLGLQLAVWRNDGHRSELLE